MASFKKFPASSVGRLFLHNNRTPNDGVTHSNEQIDSERTALNYYFKKGTAKDVSKRMDEIFAIKKDNTVVLGEMAVTLPKDVKESDEKKFFQSVYDFYCKDFGEENIVNAVVHKDESQPHIHISFIPVVKQEIILGSTQGVVLNKWKKEHGYEENDEIERLCCKELVNREYLQQMHPRLYEHVAKDLGYEVEILNGATAGGNKTVLEMKLEKTKKEYEQWEAKVTNLKKEFNEVRNIMSENKMSINELSYYPLLQKINELNQRIKVLQKIILRNQCSYTKEDYSQMQPKEYKVSKSVPINIFEGSISTLPVAIEKNAIIIIELRKNTEDPEKPLPQQELIDRSSDITVQLNFARRINENIILRKSRMSDRKYLFIKTDESTNLIELLIQMGDCLAKELKGQKRKIYMDKILEDRYDFAKSVLGTLDTEVVYCTNLKTEEKREELQEEKDKSTQE